MTQFWAGVKDMMTNALPRDPLQVIGFLSHQNHTFIDHDKVLRAEQCIINGQRRPRQARKWFLKISFHSLFNKAVTYGHFCLDHSQVQAQEKGKTC